MNILLFLGKWIAGFLSGSIAITADAFNNLSDAGSSIITLIGFRISGQRPDSEHPFGHGRMEYISGFLVSVAILIMGFELVKSSINKLIHPEPVSYTHLGAQDGYTPSVTVTENGITHQKKTAAGENQGISSVPDNAPDSLVGEKDNMVVFENNYQEIAMTGVIMNNLPFVLLVAVSVAAIGILLLMKRKTSGK